MGTGSKARHFIFASALVGTLLVTMPAFATDPDSTKMEGKKGEMMQSDQMSADEMIKKGNEMIMQGKEMKKKGMKMKKEGMMKEDKMMKENGMKGAPMDKDEMKMNK
jgi:hypothetical protein